MTSRIPRHILALCVASAMLAASIPTFADSSHDPAITEVHADSGMLHILGLNLGGGKPKVTLGTLTLSVVSMTATQIDALVPATVAPGSYLLTVSLAKSKSGGNDGNDDGKYDEFWVTIGAAGAQGPAGTAGLQGAMGPMGPQGIAGVAGAAGPAGKDGAAGAPGSVGPQGMPGLAGAGGALSSIEGLAGLPCNVAFSRDTCPGVTAITFDAATNGLGLFCTNSVARPTLVIAYDLRSMVQGQNLRIGSNPYSFLSRSLLGRFDHTSISELTCPGAVNVLTFTLSESGPMQAPARSLSVNGGGCSVTLLTNSSVECTITMDGDQYVAVQVQ